ncbi:MAG TPA: ubiquinone/menaquinone biosynthesis methyltransferase [Acidimicrobiales bacterium]|nr:ubiquinone/menaquinone biosynthesis methyltransferase [Acidimicrobiales bacterium]
MTRAPEGLLEGDEKRRAVTEMFDAIAPRYDAVNKVMTFGLDLWWRRRTVALLGLPARSLVLDLACGTGDFLRVLERAGQRPVGLDLSEGMLRHARAGSSPLVRGDGAALCFPGGAFDGAVSGFALRNFSDLRAVLAELARVVRPAGRVAVLEVAEPSAPLLRAGYRAWFNGAVPLIGRLLSDPGAYRYLPRSVAYLPAPADLVAMLEAAGFGEVRRHLLTGGAVQVLTGTRA